MKPTAGRGKTGVGRGGQQHPMVALVVAANSLECPGRQHHIAQGAQLDDENMPHRGIIRLAIYSAARAAIVEIWRGVMRMRAFFPSAT